MQVDFSDNYFALFEFPVAFDLDDQQLATRFRALQKVLHPDRYASASDAERRWSMQAAGFVNEGYQTLRRPISRASYLLSLNGIKLDEETDTHMAAEFLMEQMELREELGDAAATSDPQQALDNVTHKLHAGLEQSLCQFKEAAQRKDWQQARTVVRQWQFLDKLHTEVHAQEAQLDA